MEQVMNVMVRNMRECMYVSVSGPCGSMSVLHSKKLAFGSPLGRARGGTPPLRGGVLVGPGNHVMGAPPLSCWPR